MQTETKNQWSRDDPAFVVILSAIIILCAVLYGLAFSQGILGVLKLVVYMVLVDFLCVGVFIATILWYSAQEKQKCDR